MKALLFDAMDKFQYSKSYTHYNRDRYYLEPRRSALWLFLYAIKNSTATFLTACNPIAASYLPYNFNEVLTGYYTISLIITNQILTPQLTSCSRRREKLFDFSSHLTNWHSTFAMIINCGHLGAHTLLRNSIWEEYLSSDYHSP